MVSVSWLTRVIFARLIMNVMIRITNRVIIFHSMTCNLTRIKMVIRWMFYLLVNRVIMIIIFIDIPISVFVVLLLLLLLPCSSLVLYLHYFCYHFRHFLNILLSLFVIILIMFVTFIYFLPFFIIINIT